MSEVRLHIGILHNFISNFGPSQSTFVVVLSGRCYMAVGGYEIMVGLIVKRSPSSLSFGNVFSATHSFVTGKMGCQFVQYIHHDGAAVAVRHLLFNFTQLKIRWCP